MTRTFLIYASAIIPGENKSIVGFADNLVWIRVEEHVGWDDSVRILNYGERNKRDGEVFVNSVRLDYPE